MADGVKLNMKGADKLIEAFKATVDLTKNFKALFNKILGDPFDAPSWTLRGGTKYTMDSQQGPNGEVWPALTPSYAKWKNKNYPGRPMLFLTGRLYESLVYVNDMSVVAMTKNKLTYGTTAVYAAVNHFTYQRPYFGLRAGQGAMIQLQIRDYLMNVFNKTKGSGL